VNTADRKPRTSPTTPSSDKAITTHRERRKKTKTKLKKQKNGVQLSRQFSALYRRYQKFRRERRETKRGRYSRSADVKKQKKTATSTSASVTIYPTLALCCKKT
jgi:hypothetical protein